MLAIRLTLSGEAATRRSNSRLSLTIPTFIERLFPNDKPTADQHNAAVHKICEERTPAVAMAAEIRTHCTKPIVRVLPVLTR
jgi:hypothetical protein